MLREMARLYPGDRLILFQRPGPAPIQVDGSNVRYVPLDAHPMVFYDEMTQVCERQGAQAVIRTYPQEQHPAIPFERQIFTVPDIQHDHFAEFFSRPVLAVRRRAFAWALSCGGAIATMTEHSRSTVISHPWTMTDDIFLMPAALTEELRDSAASTGLPAAVARFDRYFYLPANLWPHKNHRRIFEALRLALPDLPARTGLVLTGNPEGLATVMDGFSDLPIIHLGFVPRGEVAALLRNAEALTYFSLFEGFGMPVLEAFHHGVPVLCSNTTSLPEVGGSAVLACDPTDVHAMAVLMCRIVNEAGLRESVLARAPERLAAYDWAKPAHALRAGLERRAHALPRPKTRLRVSLVMPTRNHGEFIRRSIDSVLAQGYPEIEFLVVDGASSDDTLDILKSYGDRIRWLSEPDRGQSDAINKGMGRVSGDILGYLNSDDILLPGAIEKVVTYFAEHPECDMVYGDADHIDREGRVTGTYDTAGFSFERLMSDCCVCQPAAFWRRRASERTGPFSTELQTAMDYEYWLRLAADGAIIHHCADKWAQSRLHDGTKTLSMRGKIFEEVFSICRAQGGYVSYSYHNGLWSYRLYESWHGGPVLKRLMPWLHRFPALAHFGSQAFALGGSRISRAQVARALFHALDRRHPGVGALVRQAWSRSALLRRSLS
ncbi:MAG: glycosyltransferase [Devosia sp.]|nr:glycosyltransferase [Devosia sp.]